MKLLLCKLCSDVFSIHMRKVKTCTCGMTAGVYIDTLNAEYKGEHAIPLFFSNHTFVHAIDNQPPSGLGRTFIAGVVPVECPTFRKVEKFSVDKKKRAAVPSSHGQDA